jgi:hypothetical protein
MDELELYEHTAPEGYYYYINNIGVKTLYLLPGQDINNYKLITAENYERLVVLEQDESVGKADLIQALLEMGVEL